MGQKPSVPDRLPNPIEISPFTLSSHNLNQNIDELGLRYKDSCAYSPIKNKKDEEVIDDEWFLKFRVGINLFNRFPTKGVQYLIEEGFVADCPTIMACFLLKCVGLSKYKISCYLGNEDDQFSIDVLRQMAEQLNISEMTIDEALRFYQKQFHLSGKKEKVELMLDVFSRKYIEMNHDAVDGFHDPVRTVSVIACALVVFNEELNKFPDNQVLQLEEFCLGIKAMVSQEHIPNGMLEAIYNRVKENKFTFGWDYYAEIYNLPIFSSSGIRVEFSTNDRRFVYDFLMHFKRGRKGSPLFRMCKRSYQGHVLIFNDSLAVLVKKRNGTYELKSFFYLKNIRVRTKEDMSSCTNKRYYIRFEDTRSDNFKVINLFTSQEKKMNDFVKILNAILEEVEETRKAINYYDLENKTQSIESDEQVHF